MYIDVVCNPAWDAEPSLVIGRFLQSEVGLCLGFGFSLVAGGEGDREKRGPQVRHIQNDF